MANSYNAIVVGGGHNGLVVGAYLARAGARTVVLEARAKAGGAAATDAPRADAPEFKVTTLSYVMSLMPDTILRDLALERHAAAHLDLLHQEGRCSSGVRVRSARAWISLPISRPSVA